MLGSNPSWRRAFYLIEFSNRSNSSVRSRIMAPCITWRKRSIRGSSTSRGRLSWGGRGRGFLLAGMDRVFATAAHEPRAKYIAEKHRVRSGTNNREAVSNADLVLLCLKPQQVRGFLREVRNHLRKNVLIVSVAASVTTSFIEREVGRVVRVIRGMPNTPCLLREAMTAFCQGQHASSKTSIWPRKSLMPWDAPPWSMRSHTPTPCQVERPIETVNQRVFDHLAEM